MKTKKSWKDKKVNVTELNLDLQNPRVPKHVKNHNDVDRIRNYLLEKEDVLRIARSIVYTGYHRTAVAIVCKENGKLVVLDGNRRLAACQLLLNPGLAPNARDRKELEDLSKSFNKQNIKSIKITISPSRKEAEKEIWDIHVNELLKPWQVLQKLRMYRNLIDSDEYDIKTASSEYGITVSKFEQELAKLYFYEQILVQLKSGKEEDELLRSGFNKIQRLILSRNGKKLLNYSIDNKGNIGFQNKKESVEKIKKIIPYIIDPGKVPAQASKDFLVTNIFSKIDPKKFSVQNENLKKIADDKNKIKKAAKGSLAKTDWVTIDEYRLYKGAGRVKDILKELNKNKPIRYENINILAVALRVVIELAIYDKLKNKGFIAKIINEQKNIYKTKGKELPPNWSPGLKEMLKFMLDQANSIVSDPQDRKAINKVMLERKDSIENLDFFIHNVSYLPTETKIREIWKTFCRPIFDIISKIG
ncbi:MAG: hypothetical protein WCK61_04900 [Candidatus Omnitrophota bacterium]